MTLIAKILLGLGLLGIGGLVYVILQQHGIVDTALKDARVKRLALDSAVEEVTRERQSLEKTQAVVVDSTNKLDLATQEHISLETLLSAAKNKAFDLQRDLVAKAAEHDAANRKLNDLMNREDVREALELKLKALTESLARFSIERTMLRDNLNGARNSLPQLQALIQNLTAPPSIDMPPVHGTIKIINRTWNFVVLDVGALQGVAPQCALNIYRGTTYLGKVRIVSAEGDSCIADIAPDIEAPLAIGDEATNQ